MHLRTLCWTRLKQYPLNSKLPYFLARQRPRNRVSIASGTFSIGVIRRTSASSAYDPIWGICVSVLTVVLCFSSNLLLAQYFLDVTGSCAPVRFRFRHPSYDDFRCAGASEYHLERLPIIIPLNALEEYLFCTSHPALAIVTVWVV